jgi:transcriptional regulator with XRE-family HTH domain
MSSPVMRPCPHCNGTGEVPESFGDRVKDAREAKGLTQAQLSEKVGISRPQIANIETNRGDASVPVLIGFSAELGVTIDWLLKGGDKP